MSANLINITDEQFTNEVIKSDNLVLVDFWAPWCGPCRMLTPTLESLAQDYIGRVKFVKLNTQENNKVANALGIRGIPTLILFHNGKPIETTVGLQPKERLKQILDRHISD